MKVGDTVKLKSFLHPYRLGMEIESCSNKIGVVSSVPYAANFNVDDGLVDTKAVDVLFGLTLIKVPVACLQIIN